MPCNERYGHEDHDGFLMFFMRIYSLYLFRMHKVEIEGRFSTHVTGWDTLIHMDSRLDSKTVISINLLSWLQLTSLSTQPFDPLPSIYSSSPNVNTANDIRVAARAFSSHWLKAQRQSDDEKVSAEAGTMTRIERLIWYSMSSNGSTWVPSTDPADQAANRKQLVSQNRWANH